MEEVAKLICDVIGSEKVELCDVASFDLARIADFENFIIGNSTIGADVWMDASNDNKWNEFLLKPKMSSSPAKKWLHSALETRFFIPKILWIL